VGVVPRFFFHVHDSEDVLDEDGLELPNRAAAELEALRGARSLACEQVCRGELHLDHRIDVVGDGGALLFSITFGDAIEVSR
jgi:hypothetical protein